MSLNGLQGIGENLKRLTLLSLSETNITNDSIRAIARGDLPHLNWLSFCTCPNVTDLDVVHLLLDNLPSLGKLYISSCSFQPESEDEDTTTTTTTTTSTQPDTPAICKRMAHFFFSGCRAASDRMVQRLISRMPNLQTLVLSQCPLLTDATFCHVADKCRHLQHVDMADCENVTDASIVSIARQVGPNDLLSVTTSHCSGITSRGFKNLLRHSKHLQSLFSSGVGLTLSQQWPDKLLQRVHLLCPSLMLLVLGLSKSRKELARSANPSLEIS